MISITTMGMFNEPSQGTFNEQSQAACEQEGRSLIITRGFGKCEAGGSEYYPVLICNPEITDTYKLKPNMTAQVAIQRGPRVVNTFPPSRD